MRYNVIGLLLIQLEEVTKRLLYDQLVLKFVWIAPSMRIYLLKSFPLTLILQLVQQCKSSPHFFFLLKVLNVRKIEGLHFELWIHSPGVPLVVYKGSRFYVDVLSF